MILYEYPKTTFLKNGKQLIIRPLLKDDEAALNAFYSRLPMEDRLRLKDDVSDPQVIKRWIYDLDYDSLLPLIVLDGDEIVANGTLQFSPIGWTKHQGEVRVTCDRRYRGKGLATVVVENLIHVAKDFGLEQLTAEFAPTLDEAYLLSEKMGFKEAAVFKDFIKDSRGAYADLALMVLDINRPTVSTPKKQE
jgi:GNAT superfamily N-acetyltransferase